MTAFSHKRTHRRAEAPGLCANWRTGWRPTWPQPKPRSRQFETSWSAAISIRSRCRSRCEGPAGIRVLLPQQCASAAGDQTLSEEPSAAIDPSTSAIALASSNTRFALPKAGKPAIAASLKRSPKGRSRVHLGKTRHTDEARPSAQLLTCRPVGIPKLGEDSDLLGPIPAGLAQQIAADKAARHLDQHHGHQRDTKRTVEFVTAVDQSQDRTDDPAVNVPGKQTPHGHAARDHAAPRARCA